MLPFLSFLLSFALAGSPAVVVDRTALVTEQGVTYAKVGVHAADGSKITSTPGAKVEITVKFTNRKGKQVTVTQSFSPAEGIVLKSTDSIADFLTRLTDCNGDADSISATATLKK